MYVQARHLSDPSIDLSETQNPIPFPSMEAMPEIIYSETFLDSVQRIGLIDEARAWVKLDAKLLPVEKENIIDLRDMLHKVRLIKLGQHQLEIKLVDLFLFLKTKLKAKSIDISEGRITSLLTDYLDKNLKFNGLESPNSRVLPINGLNFRIRFPHELVILPFNYENEESDIKIIIQCIKEYFARLMMTQSHLSEESKGRIEEEINQANIFDVLNDCFFTLNLYDENEKLPVQLRFNFDQAEDNPSDNVYRGTPYFISRDLQLCLNPLLNKEQLLESLQLHFTTFSSNPLQSVLEAQTGIIRQANVEIIPEIVWEEFIYEVTLGNCCYQSGLEGASWKKMVIAGKNNGKTELESTVHSIERIIEAKHLQQNHKAIVALCTNVYSFLSRRNLEDLAGQVWKTVQNKFLKEPTDPLMQNVDQLMKQGHIGEAYALLQVIAFLNFCALSKSYRGKNCFSGGLEPVIRFSLDQGINLLTPLDPLPYLKTLASLKSSQDPFSLFPENYKLGVESYPKDHSIDEVNWDELCKQAEILLNGEHPFLKRLGFEFILAWGVTNSNIKAYTMLKNSWPFIFENKLDPKLRGLLIKGQEVSELEEYGRKYKQDLNPLSPDSVCEQPAKALSAFLNIRSDVPLKKRRDLLDSIHDQIYRDTALFKANLRKLTKSYKDLLAEDKSLASSDNMPSILVGLFLGLLAVAEWKEALSLLPFGLQDPAFVKNWFEPMVRHHNASFMAIHWIRDNQKELYEEIIQKASDDNQYFYLIELFCRYQEFSLASELLHKKLAENTLSSLDSLLKQNDLENVSQENKQGLLRSFCRKLSNEAKTKWLELLYENPASLPFEYWKILVNLLSIEFPMSSLKFLENLKAKGWEIADQLKNYCWSSCLQGLSKTDKIVPLIQDFEAFVERFPQEYQEEASCLLFRRVIQQKKPERISQLKKILSDLMTNKNHQNLRNALDFELIRAGVVFDRAEWIQESVEKMVDFIGSQKASVQKKHFDLLDDLIEKNCSHTPFLLKLTKSLLENPAWHSSLFSLIGLMGKKIPSEIAWEMCYYVKKQLDKPASLGDLNIALINCVMRFIGSSQPLENDFLDLLFSCVNHSQFISVFDKKVKGQVYHALFQKKKRSLGLDVQKVKEYIQFFSTHLAEIVPLWPLEERRNELEWLLERLLKIRERSDVVFTSLLHLMGLSELYNELEDVELCQHLPVSTPSSLIFDKSLDAILGDKCSNKQQKAWEKAQTYVNTKKIRSYTSRLCEINLDSREKAKVLMEIKERLIDLLPLKQYDEQSLFNLLKQFVFFPFSQKEETRKHLNLARDVVQMASAHLARSSFLMACKFYVYNKANTLSVEGCKQILSFIRDEKPADEIAFPLLEKLKTVVPNELSQSIYEACWERYDHLAQPLQARYFPLALQCLNAFKDGLDKALLFKQVKSLLSNCSLDASKLVSFSKDISRLFEEKLEESPPVIASAPKGKNAKKRSRQGLKGNTNPTNDTETEISQSRNQAWSQWLNLLIAARTPETFLYANKLAVLEKKRGRGDLKSQEALLEKAWRVISEADLQKCIEANSRKPLALGHFCEKLKDPIKAIELPFALDCLLPLFSERFLDLQTIKMQSFFLKTLLNESSPALSTPMSNYALQILAQTAYPLDLSKFPSEFIKTLRESWLDIALKILEKPIYDFSKVQEAWFLTENSHLWDSIQHHDDCPIYFEFLNKLVECSLQRKDFEFINAFDLGSALNKMRLCGLTISEKVLDLMTQKAEELLRKSPDQFPSYEAFLSRCGIVSITLRLKLVGLASRILAMPVGQSAKTIVDNLKDVNEALIQQDDFQKDKELWKLIKNLFVTFFNYQFQKNLTFYKEDRDNAIKNLYSVMKLPIFKELLRQEQHPNSPRFFYQLRETLLLMYSMGIDQYKNYFDDLVNNIRDLKIPDNFIPPSNCIEIVGKNSIGFIKSLLNKPSVNPLNELKDCLEESQCLSGNIEFCDNVSKLIVNCLNGSQKWLQATPELEATTLLLGMTILNLGKKSFLDFFPYFTEFQAILQKNSEFSFSLDILDFLFNDLINSCTNKETFQKAIFSAWRHLQSYQIEGKGQEYKKQVFFKIDVIIANLCSKYGTYENSAIVGE